MQLLKILFVKGFDKIFNINQKLLNVWFMCDNLKSQDICRANKLQTFPKNAENMNTKSPKCNDSSIYHFSEEFLWFQKMFR